MKVAPTTLEAVGRYVHDSGTGGGVLNLRIDSSFFYEVFGCIPEDPIVGYSGTYILVDDTLNLTFAEVVYRESDEGRKVCAGANPVIVGMPRYLTGQYTPSFFFRYKDNVYLASHENLERVTDLNDFESKLGPLMGWFLIRQNNDTSVRP